jgi:transposase
MSTPFYDTDLTDAAWAWVAPVLPAARPGGRPRTTNLRAVLNAIFTSYGQAASGDCCHANFHRVARSTITFKPGKTPVCGSIYIECSTSRLVVMPDGQLVHRW